MKLLILITMAAMIFPLGAQEAEKVEPAAKVAPTMREAPRRVVVPAKSRQTVQRQPRVQIQNPRVEVAAKGLTENITIQLQGSMNEGPSLDLSLTGVGPVFQADVVTGEEHTILSHQYSVKPQEGGYRVEYRIGLRIRMATSKVREVTNYEYRDVSVTGTILAKEGEKVVISKDGDRELGLTLGKAK